MLNIVLLLGAGNNKLSQYAKDRTIVKMTRQRNSHPKKDPEETTARDLLKTDLSNLSESEFRITVIRILAGLETSIGNTRETLAAELKVPKTSQFQIKNAITEIQN